MFIPALRNSLSLTKDGQKGTRLKLEKIVPEKKRENRAGKFQNVKIPFGHTITEISLCTKAVASFLNLAVVA